MNKTDLPGQHAPVVVRRRRRSSFLRRLIMSGVCAILLIIVIMVGKDWLGRNEYLHSMGQLARHIEDFKQQHRYLPSHEQVLKFKSNARVNFTKIEYDPTRLPKNAPPETLLAHLPLHKMTFLPSGHASIDLGGNVHWLSEQELQEKMQLREKLYHAEMLPKSR